MRFIGIDIGSEKHALAIVDEAGKILRKPTTITEDAQGYDALLAALGDPADAFVAMEATGHYWRNLFAFLHGRGFRVVLLNPARTANFSKEEMRRCAYRAIVDTEIGPSWTPRSAIVDTEIGHRGHRDRLTVGSRTW